MNIYNNNKYNNKILYNQMMVSSQIGGAAKLAIEIHKYIQTKIGRVSQLIIPVGGEAERFARSKQFVFLGYNIERLMNSNRFVSLLENIYLQIKISMHRNQILHIHSPFVYRIMSPFLLFSRIKTVLHIHLDFTIDQLKYSLRFPPDLIFVCANSIRPVVESALSNSKESKTKIVTLINAVDTNKYFPGNRNQKKANLGISPSLPIALIAANLAPHKGQETAIRAVASLKEMDTHIKLLVAGEERETNGQYFSYLIDLSKKLNVDDRVEFLGFRNDVAQLLQAADFLLLPSKKEGLPLVILEAQASKCLTLAAPTAGIPEVVQHGQTGFTIQADNFEKYAQTISYLLKNPDHMNSLVMSAYTNVRDNLNFDRYCEQIIEEYNQLL